MSTNCIVLGQNVKASKRRPIQFVKFLDNAQDKPQIEDATFTPNCYKNIELITLGRKGDGGLEYDLMFAYNDERHNPASTLFLGFWNDGVIE